MLYSKYSQRYSKDKANGTDSSLDTGHVFTGEYWDDFALLGGPHIKRVLVLGAGYGACLRPLLAASPQARITLVDCDAAALTTAETIHHRHFPGLRFESRVADASDLSSLPQTYDLIWIDLFDNEGYADCLQHPDFYSRLAHKLTPKGVMAVNAFTVPTSLSAQKLSRSEAFFAGVFGNSFSYVARFPYRRNVTVVASRFPLCAAESSAALRPLDALVQRLARLRLCYPLNVTAGESPLRLPSFAEIGTEMGDGWDSLLPVIDVDSLSQRLMANDLSAAGLEKIAAELGEELPLLAVLAGSLSSGSDALAHAYCQLLLARGREWFDADPERFVHYLFTQWGALQARSRAATPGLLEAGLRLIEYCESGGRYGRQAVCSS